MSNDLFEDWLAITTLTHGYCRAIDFSDGELMASVLADEAVGVFGGREVAGRQAILDFFAGIESARVAQHYVTNHEIEIDPGSGTGSCSAYLWVQHVVTRPDGSTFLAPQGGVYQFGVLRTEAGWRLTRIQLSGVWADPANAEMFRLAGIGGPSPGPPPAGSTDSAGA